MKIAVEGCAHGELERIYNTIQGIEQMENIKVDLLLCCGDFQSARNLGDLQTMAVPKRYQNMCTFYKYYSGELVAPILTIFIGGNHEASNYLQELAYGGWVAPNIYYLGHAGVIRVNGIRIAGLSGIYKGHDFLRGRFEFSPYTESTRISVYHVRQLEVFRLQQLSGTIDICLSHDWPRGIYNYGNKTQLLRFKPYFRDEVDRNQLGSRPCEELLMTMKPLYWFAAHLHCKFSAVVVHDQDFGNVNKPLDQQQPERMTKFLALDKCLPKRRFLQLLDIEPVDNVLDTKEDGSVRLEYDLEWLAILRLTNHLISVRPNYYYMPGPRNQAHDRMNFTPTKEELQWVRERFDNDLRIPDNFCQTVEAFDPSGTQDPYPEQPRAQINPQSSKFCEKLGMDDPVTLSLLIGGYELCDTGLLEANDAGNTGCTNTLNMSHTQDSPMKKKLKLGLNLPAPVASASQAESLVNQSNVSVKGYNFNPDKVYLSDSSEDEKDVEDEVTKSEPSNSPVNSLALEVTENEEQTAKPSMKQFKRRNEAIYMEDNIEVAN